MTEAIATLVEELPGDSVRFAEWVSAELLKLGIDIEVDDWSHVDLWSVKRSGESSRTWHLSYR